MAIDQIVKSGTVHEIVPEIAPLFSTSTAYSVGDCVIKDAVLYRFKTAHSAGAWSASEVEAITVGEELTELNERLGFIDSFDASKTGTTGATYGQFNLTINRAVPANSKYIINMELSGVTLKDCTVYGIVSAGVYSDALLVFKELNKNFVFTAPAQYTGFYLYTNANETGTAYSAEFHLTQIDSRNNTIEISEMQSDIAELQSEVDYLSDNSVTLSEAVAFATGSVSTYSKTGTNNLWNNTSTGLAVSTPITNAKKLISVAINATSNASLYFGLFTKSENTATVKFVKQLSAPIGNNHIIVDFDIDPTETYYPFIRMISGNVTFNANSYESEYYSFSKSGAIAVNDTLTLTTVSGNGLYIIQCEILYASAEGSYANTITVAKSGGDYQTIREAVANANGTADHPVTIIIYPGIYDEVVRIGANKYVSLVGVNRDTCIIRDKSGKYANSPLLVSGAFTVENLTIIATHEDAGSWSPTWVVGDNTTYASYCVHCDGAGGDSNNPALGRFHNCKLYSECCNAAGLGLNPYQTLEFDDCVIERYVTDNAYWDDEHYTGAVACHSAVGTAVGDEHEEHLILKNCVITSNGSKALQFYHYHIGSPMDLTAIGCSLQDASGISNVVRWYRGEEANSVTQLSHGNSTDELNYSTT